MSLWLAVAFMVVLVLEPVSAFTMGTTNITVACATTPLIAVTAGPNTTVLLSNCTATASRLVINVSTRTNVIVRFSKLQGLTIQPVGNATNLSSASAFVDVQVTDSEFVANGPLDAISWSGETITNSSFALIRTKVTSIQNSVLLSGSVQVHDVSLSLINCTTVTSANAVSVGSLVRVSNVRLVILRSFVVVKSIGNGIGFSCSGTMLNISVVIDDSLMQLQTSSGRCIGCTNLAQGIRLRMRNTTCAGPGIFFAHAPGTAAASGLVLSITSSFINAWQGSYWFAQGLSSSVIQHVSSVLQSQSRPVLVVQGNVTSTNISSFCCRMVTGDTAVGSVMSLAAMQLSTIEFSVIDAASANGTLVSIWDSLLGVPARNSLVFSFVVIRNATNAVWNDSDTVVALPRAAATADLYARSLSVYSRCVQRIAGFSSFGSVAMYPRVLTQLDELNPRLLSNQTFLSARGLCAGHAGGVAVAALIDGDPNPTVCGSSESPSHSPSQVARSRSLTVTLSTTLEVSSSASQTGSFSKSHATDELSLTATTLLSPSPSEQMTLSDTLTETHGTLSTNTMSRSTSIFSVVAAVVLELEPISAESLLSIVCERTLLMIGTWLNRFLTANSTNCVIPVRAFVEGLDDNGAISGVTVIDFAQNVSNNTQASREPGRTNNLNGTTASPSSTSAPIVTLAPTFSPVATTSVPSTRPPATTAPVTLVPTATSSPRTPSPATALPPTPSPTALPPRTTAPVTLIPTSTAPSSRVPVSSSTPSPWWPNTTNSTTVAPLPPTPTPAPTIVFANASTGTSLLYTYVVQRVSAPLSEPLRRVATLVANSVVMFFRTPLLATLVLPPNAPTFAALTENDMIVEFAVDHYCLARRDVGNVRFNITIQHILPIAPLSGPVLSVGMPLVAGLSLFTIGSPLVVIHINRAQTAFSVYECVPSTTSLFVFQTPAPWNLKEPVVGYYFGGAVLNVVMLSAFLLLVGVAVLGRCVIQRSTVVKSAAFFKFPSILSLPTMWLLHPTVMCCITVFLRGTISTDQWVCLGFIVACAMVVVVLCARHVMYFHAQKHNAVERSVVMRMVQGNSSWCEAEGEEAARYCERHLLWFREYRAGYEWMYMVEATLCLVLGAIEGVKLGEGRCSSLSILVAALFGCYLLLMAVARPYEATFQNVLAVAVSGIEFLGAVALVLYSSVVAASEVSTRSLLSSLAVQSVRAVFALLVLRALVDAFILGHAIKERYFPQPIIERQVAVNQLSDGGDDNDVLQLLEIVEDEIQENVDSYDPLLLERVVGLHIEMMLPGCMQDGQVKLLSVLKEIDAIAVEQRQWKLFTDSMAKLYTIVASRIEARGDQKLAVSDREESHDVHPTEALPSSSPSPSNECSHPLAECTDSTEPRSIGRQLSYLHDEVEMTTLRSSPSLRLSRTAILFLDDVLHDNPDW